MRPNTSYLICATARCGSTLLCEALAGSGVAGKPKEYFLWKDEAEYARTWGVSDAYPEYLQRVLSEGSSSNGIFGGKIMWYGFPDLVNRIALAARARPVTHSAVPGSLTRERARILVRTARHMPGFLTYRRTGVHELLAKTFPSLRYIHIRRRDKVAQAISQWTLSHTKVPFLRDGEIVRVPRREPRFDFRSIDVLVRRIAEHEDAWDQYFLESRAQPFRVDYEDLVDSYEPTGRTILQYLGVKDPASVALPEARMQRQADARSIEWARQYREIKESRALQRA